MLEQWFPLRERGTTLGTELTAGVTTFVTMAYIIFVNPGILTNAGVPFAGATTATALGAAVMSVAMGLITNRPLALASGMGLNAVLTFSVIGVQQAHVPWQTGMAVIFVEGVVILILVLTGLRQAIMFAIPQNLKRAIGAGIGLFITVIGLVQGGIIRPAPVTLVALGDFSQRYVWVTLIGLTATLLCLARRMRAGILLGMVVATVAALVLGVTAWPRRILEWPDFSTFGAPFQTTANGRLAIARVLSPALLAATFSLLLTDFFDTMGTVVAVGEQAGFVRKDGSVPGLTGILLVDSAAAAIGGLFGASSVTTYIESAAGVAAGGRTGLTAVVAGLCFVLAIFFTPVIAMIGGGVPIASNDYYRLLAESGFTVPGATSCVYPITASALIVVGFLMMGILREISWDNFEEAFPAFLTVVGIPLTYNISYGIGLGFIAYVLLTVLHGRARDVHPLLYGASIAFALMFALPAIEKMFP